MVTTAIIDTSILIDDLRGSPPAKAWFAQASYEILAITPVVWMEVIQGAANKARQLQAIEFLETFALEHPITQDNPWAMDQVALYTLSHNVLLADAMIASVALRLAVPPYTRNLKHFLPMTAVQAVVPYQV